MTKQETFDLVVTHLLTQNELSTNGNICAYRGVDGRKCAVGALIPDELYDRLMEGVAADSDRVAFALQALGHDVRLCSKLQAIHDVGNVARWRDELAEFAADQGLAFNPPAVST